MTLFIIGILLSLVIVVLIYQTISKRYNIIEDMNKEGFTFDIKGNTKRREGEINDLMKLTNYNKTSVDNELMAQNNPDIDNFPGLEIIDDNKNTVLNPQYKLVNKEIGHHPHLPSESPVSFSHFSDGLSFDFPPSASSQTLKSLFSLHISLFNDIP